MRWFEKTTTNNFKSRVPKSIEISLNSLLLVELGRTFKKKELSA